MLADQVAPAVEAVGRPVHVGRVRDVRDRAGPRERAHGACGGRHGRLAGCSTKSSTLRAHHVVVKPCVPDPSRSDKRPTPGAARLPCDGRRRPPGPPPQRGTTTRADPGSARDRTGRPADHAHHDHRACRVSARLPRHLRHARHRRGRPRDEGRGRPGAPVHPRRAVRQGQQLPGEDLQPRPRAAPAAAHRAQGQRPVRARSPGTRRWTPSPTPFRARIAEHGPETVMPVSYLGTQGILNGLVGGRRRSSTSSARRSPSAPTATPAPAPPTWPRSGRRRASTPRAWSTPATSSSGRRTPSRRTCTCGR